MLVACSSGVLWLCGAQTCSLHGRRGIAPAKICLGNKLADAMHVHVGSGILLEVHPSSTRLCCAGSSTGRDSSLPEGTSGKASQPRSAESCSVERKYCRMAALSLDPPVNLRSSVIGERSPMMDDGGCWVLVEEQVEVQVEDRLYGKGRRATSQLEPTLGRAHAIHQQLITVRTGRLHSSEARY